MAQITEDYVSFETAKLLKEKGFDAVCRTAYETITNEHEVEQCSPSSWGELNQVKRPTLQMAMKWLREKHIVIVTDVEKFYADGSVSSWIYHIWCDDNFEENVSVHFNTYEEACEAAIKYCLENFI